jgi:hypothetical protein
MPIYMNLLDGSGEGRTIYTNLRTADDPPPYAFSMSLAPPAIDDSTPPSGFSNLALPPPDPTKTPAIQTPKQKNK